MNADQLTDGMVVRLITDVVNPAPDRRQKYRCDKLPVWKTGTKFVVERFEIGRTMDAAVSFWRLQPNVPHARPVSEFTSEFDLLINACVPVADTLSTIMQRYSASNWGYEHVLQVLVNEGRITLDDVYHALDVELPE